MGALESNTTLIYGIHIRESANDGSDFSNGATDYRVLFLGEDGFLHVKDSAGSVSDPYDTGGAGIASGTSFPGGPSTGDLFHRTDLQPPLWRYDGTRWLCTCLHEHHLGHAVNVSATTDIYTPNIHADMYLVNFIVSMEAASGLSGSAYWRADLYTKDAGSLSAVLATFNIQSGTNANMIRGSVAINALLAAGEDGFILEFAKVSTPGNLWGGGIVTYHLTAS